jgi:hypothetical protein
MRLSLPVLAHESYMSILKTNDIQELFIEKRRRSLFRTLISTVFLGKGPIAEILRMGKDWSIPKNVHNTVNF